MPTLYLETSIISFLRSRPATHVVSAARQLLTQRWWNEERAKYELLTSQFVLDESSRGDPTLVEERLKALAGIPLLEIVPEISVLAQELLSAAVLPARARLDALHISAASYHSVEYLLTWNCAHIANARILPRVRKIVEEHGYAFPIVCTPEEMVDEQAAT